MCIIRNCVGYRSEQEHDNDTYEMVHIMGVEMIDSERIMEEHGKPLVPSMNSLVLSVDE